MTGLDVLFPIPAGAPEPSASGLHGKLQQLHIAKQV